MSRKSRQRNRESATVVGVGPRQAITTAATAATATTATVESTRRGVPFGVVVLLATTMSIPTIWQMADESMSFDAGVTRLLIALAVAWLLSNLVYAVIDGMRPDEGGIDLQAPVAGGDERTAEPAMPYAPMEEGAQYPATGT